MTSVWKEKFDPNLHRDKMDSFRHVGLSDFTKDNLRVAWVYFVHECSFTFTFMDLDQATKCLDYFSNKIHPSTRVDIGAADHWEMQRWYERIPAYLRSEKNRLKVVKAIKKLMEDDSKNKLVCKNQ